MKVLKPSFDEKSLGLSKSLKFIEKAVSVIEYLAELPEHLFQDKSKL
ncbi:MAG: hypothetical protein IH840_00225 [Candidatus Heimdallarchaeota archaeon]|nr:hypothetical protein [Candidatus Heimdallarchaeota archaeon]